MRNGAPGLRATACSRNSRTLSRSRSIPGSVPGRRRDTLRREHAHVRDRVDEHRPRRLAEGLVPHTDSTVTDTEEYRRVIAEARRLGYGASYRQWIDDGAGVASPFFDAS